MEAEYRRACYLAGPFSPTNQPVLFLLPIKMFHTTLDSVFSIRPHLTLAPKPTELTTKKSRKPPYLRGGCPPRGEPHLFFCSTDPYDTNVQRYFTKTETQLYP